ncbi:hypothetical protein GGF31_007031 [Allomyces arbusculus]|nr:hypothetical protein GGF31_007031 [Allomyces arbusculus]
MATIRSASSLPWTALAASFMLLITAATSILLLATTSTVHADCVVDKVKSTAGSARAAANNRLYAFGGYLANAGDIESSMIDGIHSIDLSQPFSANDPPPKRQYLGVWSGIGIKSGRYPRTSSLALAAKAADKYTAVPIYGGVQPDKSYAASTLLATSTSSSVGMARPADLAPREFASVMQFNGSQLLVSCAFGDDHQKDLWLFDEASQS